jgi:hypothetical protein
MSMHSGLPLEPEFPWPAAGLVVGEGADESGGAGSGVGDGEGSRDGDGDAADGDGAAPAVWWPATDGLGDGRRAPAGAAPVRRVTGRCGALCGGGTTDWATGSVTPFPPDCGEWARIVTETNST